MAVDCGFVVGSLGVHCFEVNLWFIVLSFCGILFQGSFGGSFGGLVWGLVWFGVWFGGSFECSFGCSFRGFLGVHPKFIIQLQIM